MSMNDCVFTDYVPTKWIDGVTPINSENLNHIEQGVYSCSQQIQSLGVGVSVLNDEVFETCLCESGGVKAVSKIKKLETAQTSLAEETKASIEKLNTELKTAETKFDIEIAATKGRVSDLLWKVEELGDMIESGEVTRSEFKELQSMAVKTDNKVTAVEEGITEINATLATLWTISEGKSYVDAYVDKNTADLYKYVDERLEKVPVNLETEYYNKTQVDAMIARLDARITQLEGETYLAPQGFQLSVCGVDPDNKAFEVSSTKEIYAGSTIKQVRINFTKGTKAITDFQVNLGMNSVLGKTGVVEADIYDLEEPFVTEVGKEYAFSAMISDGVTELTDALTVISVKRPDIEPAEFTFTMVDKDNNQITKDTMVKDDNSIQSVVITYVPGNVEIETFKLKVNGSEVVNTPVVDNLGTISTVTNITVAAYESKVIDAVVIYSDVEHIVGTITLTGRPATLYHFYGASKGEAVTAADFETMTKEVYDESGEVNVQFTFDDVAKITFAHNKLAGEISEIFAVHGLDASELFELVGEVTVDNDTYCVHRQKDDVNYPVNEFYQFKF